MSQACLYVAKSIEVASLPDAVCTPGTDVEHFCVDSFGITDARMLADRAYVRPVVDTKKEFLVNFNSITIEAQNALLKLFEEPPETATFHVVISREDMLIATLRSRLLLKERSQNEVDRTAMRAFLKMDMGQRLSEIAARTKVKDTAWIEAVVAGAEAFAEHVRGDTKHKILKSVVLVRQYLAAPSSGKKMLLEELALSLPRIK